MILVVGATGMLGGEICRLLADAGKPVRALVRASSDPQKIQALRDLGAEIAEGDLRDRGSLEGACAGVTAVVSSANAIASRQEGDSFAATDLDGHANLVAAAEQAGVERIVYVSFIELDADVPAQDAKRAVERLLASSSLTFTVLRSGLFMEMWLSPRSGFDVENRQARLFGPGDRPVNWISFHDAAAAAVAALDSPATRNAIVELASDYMPPADVVAIFEDATGTSFDVDHIPEEALVEQAAGAGDETEKTFAGLGLSTARGHTTDASGGPALLGLRPTSLREYAAASVSESVPSG